MRSLQAALDNEEDRHRDMLTELKVNFSKERAAADLAAADRINELMAALANTRNEGALARLHSSLSCKLFL